ncbi:glycosyltransferase [Tepidimonas thermarum]|nr:glycosyltransferase [Tepidimonas thermarum]
MPTMPADIRPLHLGKYLPPPDAGVEAHVDLLLRGLQPLMPCTLVAGDSPTGAPCPTVPYRVLRARNGGQFASAFLTPGVIPLALRELRSGRCNLLHLHLPNPWADLLALLAPRHIPVVATWHSDIVRQRLIMPIYRHIQRATLQRVQRVIVATPGHVTGSHQLRGGGAEQKILHIPYGLDLDALTPAHADANVTAALRAFAAGRPMVLTIGRHVYYKGYEHLIRAFGRMQQTAVLVMVGQGPLTAELRALAQQQGVSDRIRFMGAIPRPALLAALHACDIFTLPSVEPSEAFGLASAEAMAFGKPTVVCQLGNGVNVLNRDGVTSLAVPPRDPDALAAALDRLVANPALRRTMGAAARQHIQQHYSAAAMVAATAALYRQLVHG